MTTGRTPSDPYAYDDGAYVLGALSDEERSAFEAHLRTCADCRARVAEVRGVPALLAQVTAEDVGADPMPDTLLPGLLRRAGQRRERQRWLIGGLAAVAAACLVVLALAVWPFGSSGGTSAPQARAMSAVLTGAPVQADARLVAKSWGTEIDLRCSYKEGVQRAFPYELVVVGTDGAKEVLGSWTVPVGKDIEYSAGTRLSTGQISKVQIAMTDGTPVLELDT